MSPTTRLASFAAVAAIAACSSPAKKQRLSMQDMLAADPLPLSKGAKWTYDVKVKRFDPDSDKETTKTLQWTTEVLDVREGNGITAYRVKGWPGDLAAMDQAVPLQTERTILRSNNNFLFGATTDPNLDNAEGWFTWPLVDGQKFCPKAQTVYCWQVAAVETGYELSLFTGPDEQTFQLEPNTGVSRYHYAHHGTTNEVEAKLVSFERGPRR
jgi:hypothetical protein